MSAQQDDNRIARKYLASFIDGSYNWTLAN